MTRRKDEHIHIGTSGWHYAHWRGPFYPADLRPSDYLEHYARAFRTVEVNSSFYRLPSVTALKGWSEATPPGFVFACKASRFLTHMKKLKDPEQGMPVFLERIGLLGDKLGPLLFQLPPNWRPNAARLAAFLEALPREWLAAFELRDQRWHCPEILELLARHNRALCLFDLAGEQSPIALTADFVYIRLHGPGAAYEGSYSDEALADWAERVAAWAGDGLDVYCYFDNDAEGYAPKDAGRLKAFLASR